MKDNNDIEYQTGQAVMDDDVLVVKTYNGWETINNGEDLGEPINPIIVSELEIIEYLLKEGYQQARDEFARIEPNMYHNGYIRIGKSEDGKWSLFGKGTTTTQNARNLGMATLDADRAVTALNLLNP
jgi:hypothetical protein